MIHGGGKERGVGMFQPCVGLIYPCAPPFKSLLGSRNATASLLSGHTMREREEELPAHM
jgi:hypothetical protein